MGIYMGLKYYTTKMFQNQHVQCAKYMYGYVNRQRLVDMFTMTSHTHTHTHTPLHSRLMVPREFFRQLLARAMTHLSMRYTSFLRKHFVRY